MPPSDTSIEPPVRQRIDSVDVLRGLVMIIMALDHTRDFFGSSAADPTNLATTTVGLFLTRWITHFCAPVFFLLTGVGASLSRRRRTISQLSRFLLTRGLWFVLLELTVLRFFWQFNLDYQVTIVTVLWALGWSMVVLAGLVRLPTWASATIGAVMVLGHNLFDGLQPAAGGATLAWTLLHRPGVLYAVPGYVVIDAYPLVPWIGVMVLGYAIGPIFSLDAARRRRLLLRSGIAIVAVFLLLRASNLYGDPSRWSAQHSAVFTVLSFLNLNKYPPSLLYLLMTLGPALLVLRALDNRTPRVLRPARTVGTVPFFYFMLHVVVIHLLAVAVAWARYGAVHWMFESSRPEQYPATQPPGWPLPLPLVYLAWVTVVLICYPLCRWYAGVKSRSRSPWLSYL